MTGISRVPVLLAGDLLSAIVQAAKIVGDEGFYLKGHLPENDDVVAWYVPFSNISEYESAGQGTSPRLSTATAFEHTLISPSGKWAIVTSHEDHMLLASNQEFTEAFEPLVSGLENQIFTFLENWRGIRQECMVSVRHWLPSLLKQIYGEDRGNELLLNYNLLDD